MNCVQRRYIHTCLTTLLRNRRGNPGAAYQLKELDNKEELSHDAEAFGNMEADFTNLHSTHKQYENELQRQKEQIRRAIVKRKYFSGTHLPNLLTYEEKEQIRMLHGQNADEWTNERLAESFPVTPEIVKKLLAAKWRPHSVRRIKKHDELVKRNWSELRSGGELAKRLPPSYLEHLEKFITRHMNVRPLIAAEHLLKRTALPPPKGREFLSIITSGEKDTTTNDNKSSNRVNLVANSQPPEDPECETYLVDKVKDKRKMRLQELKQQKLTAEELAPFEPAFAIDSGQNSSSAAASTLLKNYSIEKFSTSEIVITSENQLGCAKDRMKNRIHIPRKLFRKGGTYRIGDCYYDDDGEFLYSVPGMTEHKST